MFGGFTMCGHFVEIARAFFVRENAQFKKKNQRFTMCGHFVEFARAFLVRENAQFSK